MAFSCRARPWSLFVVALRLRPPLIHRSLVTTPHKMAGKDQVTNRVMLIKPSCFNYNPETAVSNDFQSKIESLTDEQVQQTALKEFDTLVDKLKEIKITVKIFEDDSKVSPDAVFPNNWISFHSEPEEIVVYPMLSFNRRQERNADIISYWTGVLSSDLVEYTQYESQDRFLEGTGSMVLDRVNRIAYACKSPRTDGLVLKTFCRDFGYHSVMFRSALSPKNDGHLQDVYHTNVMMSVGETFAIVCLESISDEAERKSVIRSLEETNKDIIPITTIQVNEFAGNVLELVGQDGRKHLIMSTRAHSSLTDEQLHLINQHCDNIVSVPLDVIERAGGGGVRCMIAEVFPPL